MFFFLSKTVDFFLMPISFVGMLLLYAFFTRNRTKARRAILATFMLMVLLTNKYLVTKAFEWWSYDVKNISEVQTTYDVGIILTGGMMSISGPEIDHPSMGVHADRFFQAYLLYKAGKIKKFLISGADMPHIMQLQLDDGALVKRTLIQWGVPAEDIILEGESRNTRQNAVNSSLILKKQFPNGKYVLITSSFHLRRAIGCFEEVGITTDIFPADSYSGSFKPTLRDYIRPDPNVFGYSHLLWREWVGYLMYKIAGYC
jgi:uncharacterized SAM-binding protein YcdF (DUF218 family)